MFKDENYLALVLSHPFETRQQYAMSLSSLTCPMSDKGSAHRDIKPQNILIQSRQPLIIKLADLGMAKNIIDLII
jgi:serine/threonine protein kinase